MANVALSNDDLKVAEVINESTGKPGTEDGQLLTEGNLDIHMKAVLSKVRLCKPLAVFCEAVFRL